jgi:hypothetical protein
VPPGRRDRRPRRAVRAQTDVDDQRRVNEGCECRVTEDELRDGVALTYQLPDCQATSLLLTCWAAWPSAERRVYCHDT